jgi:hypothetical protein
MEMGGNKFNIDGIKGCFYGICGEWVGGECVWSEGVEIDKTGLGCGTAAWYCAFGLVG